MQDYDESFVLWAKSWMCNSWLLDNGQHFNARIFTLNYLKAVKSLKPQTSLGIEFHDISTFMHFTSPCLLGSDNAKILL